MCLRTTYVEVPVETENVRSLKLELQTASYKPVCGYRD